MTVDHSSRLLVGARRRRPLTGPHVAFVAGRRTQSWSTSPASGGSAAGATNRRRGTRCSGQPLDLLALLGPVDDDDVDATGAADPAPPPPATAKPPPTPTLTTGASDGFIAQLAGADPHQPVQVDGPDLAVADLAGAGRRGDQVDDLVRPGWLSTSTSILTLGTNSILYSDPRNISVLPPWRPIALDLGDGEPDRHRRREGPPSPPRA